MTAGMTNRPIIFSALTFRVVAGNIDGITA